MRTRPYALHWVEGQILSAFGYMTIPASLDRFVIEQERLDPNSKSVSGAARYRIEILGPLPE